MTDYKRKPSIFRQLEFTTETTLIELQEYVPTATAVYHELNSPGSALVLIGYEHAEFEYGWFFVNEYDGAGTIVLNLGVDSDLSSNPRYDTGV